MMLFSSIEVIAQFSSKVKSSTAVLVNSRSRLGNNFIHKIKINGLREVVPN